MFEGLARLAAITLFLGLLGPVQAATVIAGRVVAIADGDTLTLLDAESRQHIIRLDGIDAPEKAQPFGNVSKKHLSDLAYNREATAECHKVDRYGRSVCRVIVEGIDVCLEQIKAGLAWHFKRYEREQSAEHRAAYRHAEEAAKGARVGLWRDAQPVAPWDCRAAMRERMLCGAVPRGPVTVQEGAPLPY